MLEAEQLISVRQGVRGGAHVHAPDTDVAARYAGLVLEHSEISLADGYVARVLLESPCARLLGMNRSDDDLAQLWRSVDEGEAIENDRHRLIRHHTDFHALVVRLADSHTITLLSSMLRHIIENANFHRVDIDSTGPTTDHAFDHGIRAHRRLVSHIADGDAERAEALWRKHLEEANQFLLDVPGPMTILDLLD